MSHHADHGFRKANSIVLEFLRFVHEDDSPMPYITLCANLSVTNCVPCMLVNNQSMKLHKLILRLSSEYYKMWYNVFNCRFLVRIFHSSIRNIYWIKKPLYPISWFLMKDCFMFNRMAFVGQVIELL